MRRPGAELFKARVGRRRKHVLQFAAGEPGRLSTCSARTATRSSCAPATSYDEIAKNSISEMSLATPAADGDSLYVRTQTKLYRVKAGASASRGE